MVAVSIPWDDGGGGGLPRVGEGVIAKRDDTWSNIGEGVGGDGAEDDVKDVEDEPDRTSAADTGRREVEDLEMVLCQSNFNPDGLFRSVGRTSSSGLSVLFRLGALHGWC